MVVIDPIADMLTRIRNAQMAIKDVTVCPYSKVKESICKVLKEYKFITEYSVEKNGDFKELSISFNPEKGSLELSRVSKPGQRIYVPAGEIPRVKNGMGLAIISTSSGIMSGYRAKAQGIGGELLCVIS